MIENDTIRLLRECDAGIKTGVSAVKESMEYVKDEKLQDILRGSINEHEKLRSEADALLCEYHDDGKDPNPIAETMTRVKTEVKMAVSRTDKAAAELITDGCNMGIKSLSRYLNEFAAADEKSKNLAKKIIKIEEKLAEALRDYL